MIYPALGFLAGIVGVMQLQALPENTYLWVIAAVAVLSLYFRSWIFFAFCVGIIWASWVSMQVLDQQLAKEKEGRILIVEGRVVDIPVRRDKRIRFDFRVTHPEAGVPGKIRLNWYFPDPLIKAGQYWQLAVKLKKPHGRFNPAAFDYEGWLFRNRIAATGYVRQSPEPRLLGEDTFSIAYWRNKIAEYLQEHVENPRISGIFRALAVGDKSHISQQDWAVFRSTGTAHLVAISGLHIGLIAGLVYWLSLRFWLFCRIRVLSPQRIAIVTALLIAVLYAALAGFSLPTQRALVMVTITFLAVFWQRHIKFSQLIALALLAVLIFDPLAVLSAGFWLSFLAVIFIIYSASCRLGYASRWKAAIKIHCVTALGLAPVLMFYFQQFSLIAPVANIVAVPVVSLLIVPMLLFSVVVSFLFPGFANIILSLLEYVFHVLWRFLSFCHEFSWASFSTAPVTLFSVLLAVLGVFILLAPKGVPGRYLGGFFLLPALMTNPESLKSGELRMTLLDVGQGLSVVVQTQNHVLLFDTGAKFSEDSDMGKSVVLPYLQFRQIAKIDQMIISHGDNDHAGGLGSIVSAMPVLGILTSEVHVIERYPEKARYCQEGQQWQWDGVDFKVLSPADVNFFEKENNNSCVLKITAGDNGFLLPGDIEYPAEAWLLQHHREEIQSNVLIAAHHGSKTSSGQDLLQAVKPTEILISSGYRNRFSFPHTEVLKRFQQLGIRWVNTADKGAIIVKTDGGRLTVDASRDQYGHFWN